MKKFIYIFFVFFAASCAKDDPVLPPDVNFTAPLENAFFNVPSTIHVKANISAESIIESASVRLVDLNFTPRSEQVNLTPNESSFELDEFINIEDIYLESDLYYIEIIATSQGETKRKYRAINLNEYPKEFESVFAAHSSGEVTIIQGMADTLEFDSYSNSFGTQATDLAIVNNYFGQYIIAKSNGDIFAYSKTNNELLWEYNDSDPLNLTFYNDAQVYVENRTVYFSNNKGEIVGLNEFGQVVQVIQVEDSGLGVGQFIIENNTLICEVSVSPIESKLKVYTLSTGELIRQVPLDIHVKNIIKIEDGEFLIAGKAIGSGELQMQIYYSEIDAFFSPESFDAGEVHDIINIEDGRIVVAHSSGVHTYNYNDNSIYLINQNQNVTSLAYDDVNETLILAADYQIVYYSLQSNSEINSFATDLEVASLDIVYNK